MLMKSILLSLSLLATTVSADNADIAKEIVGKKCHLCHGHEGESSSAIYPRLAGQHASYIVKQLADFKAGRRKGTMNEMAADLSEQEMLALGEYFAAKPAKSHRVRDKDFAAVGKFLYERGNKYSGVAACKSCHGELGYGSENLPRLAGQHKRYVMSQLQEFNKRTRSNDNAIMRSIAENLTELEIEALARYVSGLK